jgi:HPt (histidine-containing phosphotransfer) domain-containing protein
MRGDKEKCLAAGMDYYISKPVKLDELSAALKDFSDKIANHKVAANDLNNCLESAATPGTTDKYPSNGESAFTLVEVPECPVDVSVFKSLWNIAGDDAPELVEEIVKLFLEDTPHHIIKAQSALSSRDADTLSKVAHSLKGSSAYIGAQKMSALCLTIEEDCKREDLPAAAIHLEEINHEFEKVGDYLKSNLNGAMAG